MEVTDQVLINLHTIPRYKKNIDNENWYATKEKSERVTVDMIPGPAAWTDYSFAVDMKFLILLHARPRETCHDNIGKDCFIRR